jgi:hypothetical protein
LRRTNPSLQGDLGPGACAPAPPVHFGLAHADPKTKVPKAGVGPPPPPRPPRPGPTRGGPSLGPVAAGGGAGPGPSVAAASPRLPEQRQGALCDKPKNTRGHCASPEPDCTGCAAPVQKRNRPKGAACAGAFAALATRRTAHFRKNAESSRGGPFLYRRAAGRDPPAARCLEAQKAPLGRVHNPPQTVCEKMQGPWRYRFFSVLGGFCVSDTSTLAENWNFFEVGLNFAENGFAPPSLTAGAF